MKTIAFSVVIGFWSASTSAAAGAEKLVITHGPYLQQPTDTSIIVVWFTSRNCVSKVEYGTDEKLGGSTAVSAHHGLIDANTTRHAVRITGLKPGTTYRYRTVSTEILSFQPYKVTYGPTVTSDVLRFRTLDPAKDSFAFCVVNDIHEHDAKLDAMLKDVSWDAVDLVFLNGDMVNHINRQQQIFAGFVDVCVRRFATAVPFIYVRGNHETRGSVARDLMDVFPTIGGRFYHSFDHGRVHFIILDSGEDKPDSSEEYSGLAAFDPYRQEQADWLRADVKTEAFRKASFQVALFHMPPYGGNNWHGETHLRALWNPILNEAGIDLLICGHTHKFARLDPAKDANGYPIVIGSTDTIIRGDVADEKLTVTVTGPDQNVLDTISIAKE